MKNRLQNELDKSVNNKTVFGAAACVKTKGMDWCGASGEFQKEDQFFIASTTKLFITAIILKLRQERRIFLDDKISNYIPQAILSGLHIFKGKEYSYELTIKQLMAHTSGLPDYFQQKDANGRSLENELLSGNDKSWSFEQAIAESKKMKPSFRPGHQGKAHYSDTNYQLLGGIIEKICDEKLEIVLDEMIAQPLGLIKTYLYHDINDKRPKNIYNKNRRIHIPRAMSSFTADGGVVSTAHELMVFIEAFFTGELFPIEYIQELKKWNKIFFPLESGVGMHRYKLPWILSPFRPIPELIGHSGLSGTFAFHCPSKDTYLTGTINQIYKPSTAYKLMIKLLSSLH